jgi:hypothetical protein
MRARLPIAIGGLVIGLGAIVAVIFVLAEPVAAIEDLREDPGPFSPAEQRSMIEGRLHEAGVPLIIGTVAGAVALAVALIARRSTLGAVAILVACIALATAAYVWSRYGSLIGDHL